MKVLMYSLIVSVVLSSCSLYKERQRERKIQTEIIARINEQAKKFSSCTEQSELFQKLDAKRVRVVLNLSINANGQIEKYHLDNKKYPQDFADCMYKVLDLISFPKIKEQELIVLEQPFIFSKK